MRKGIPALRRLSSPRDLAGPGNSVVVRDAVSGAGASAGTSISAGGTMEIAANFAASGARSGASWGTSDQRQFSEA